MSPQQIDVLDNCRLMPRPAGESAGARRGGSDCGAVVVLTHALSEAEWDKVRAFVRRTSRESLRLRFGQVVDWRDERTLRRFVDIDGTSGEMIWISEEGGAICAMAHLVGVSPEQAEIALIVRSDRTRLGIGERLLRITLAHAAKRGLMTLTAFVLYENTGMLRLARKVGFKARPSHGLTVELEHHLDHEPIEIARARASLPVEIEATPRP